MDLIDEVIYSQNEHSIYILHDNEMKIRSDENIPIVDKKHALTMKYFRKVCKEDLSLEASEPFDSYYASSIGIYLSRIYIYNMSNIQFRYMDITSTLGIMGEKKYIQNGCSIIYQGEYSRREIIVYDSDSFNMMIDYILRKKKIKRTQRLI